MSTRLSHSDQCLPRLLYLGDVPVEATYHGSALLYRLLQNYPHDRLLILQPTASGPQVGRRLSATAYRQIIFGNRRLLHSRAARYYRSWLVSIAGLMSGRIDRASVDFKPEAVLTVAHGVSWIAAAAFARLQGLPLYLIVHDDWPRVSGLATMSLSRKNRLFGSILRRAQLVFCVSPAMRETYEERYSARTSLLYPSQSKITLPSTDLDVSAGRDGIVIAFAGTINSDGYARLLRLVARVLECLEGKLLLFGPHTTTSLTRWGLACKTVGNCGLVDSDQIASVLKKQAHVLLVPMSFEAYEKENMRLGFPSKIPEYAATGLPMLIFGPDYCSAVRWARNYQPVAEVVTSLNEEDLLTSVSRLKAPEYREMLRKHALEVGERLFSHRSVESQFLSHLTGSRSDPTTFALL
jgi:Glycosyltransferase Family 4